MFSVSDSEMGLPFLSGAINESLDFETGRLEAAVFKRGRLGGDHKIGSYLTTACFGCETPCKILVRCPRVMA